MLSHFPNLESGCSSDCLTDRKNISSHHFFKISFFFLQIKVRMTCAKRKNMSDPELLLGWTAWRGLYCCVTRGIVQCFQLTCQCGMKASPGGGGPLFQKVGGLQKVSPITNWMWWLEFSAYTGGSHNRTGQVRLMVQTVPQHRQSSWVRVRCS